MVAVPPAPLVLNPAAVAVILRLVIRKRALIGVVRPGAGLAVVAGDAADAEGVVAAPGDVGAEIVGGLDGGRGGHQAFVAVKPHFVVLDPVDFIPHSVGAVPLQ